MILRAFALFACGAFVAPWAVAESVTWTRTLPSPAAALPTLHNNAVLPGTVVLTREAVGGPSTAALAAEVAAMQQQQAALRDYAQLQAELAQARAAKEATAAALAQINTQTAATEARLRAETQRKLADVQQLANIRLRGLEDVTAQKLDALQANTQQQLASNADQTAAKLDSLQASTQQQLTSTAALTAEKLDSLKTVTQLQLATNTERTTTAVKQLTETTSQRLASIEQLTQSNRQLAQAETANVVQTLRAYADSQLANVRIQTAETVKGLAAANRLQTADLQAATARELARFYTQAEARAEQLANDRAGRVAEQVAALQQRVSLTTLSPAQVQVLAAQTVADAAPQFQALALNTLKDAQGYLKTIARSAVMDNDPAMQAALGQAVATALAEEKSPAAFSMRRAITGELAMAKGVINAGVNTGARAGARASPNSVTRLGDDMGALEPAAGGGLPEETIDAARLRLGRLLNPSSAGITPADNPSQLATLTPNHDPREAQVSLQRSRTRTDLMNLRDYNVVVHTDNVTLPDMLAQVISRAEPFTGPWEVRWRLKPDNQDLLQERFSLDAETTFAEFVSYLAQYLINDRGVKLSFSLFDRERVVLVSD